MESKLIKSKSCLEIVLVSLAAQQKNRNYLKAQKLKNQAEDLKKQIKQIQKKQYRRKITQQKEEMNQMLQQQTKKLEQKWKIKIEEAQRQAEQMYAEQILKQHQQIDKIRKQHNEQQFSDHYNSATVLLLKKKQQLLSKQQKFLEAHQIQKQRIKLQNSEMETIMKLKSQKLKIKLRQISKRQQAQKQALKKKIEAKLQNLRAENKKDLTTSNQRHKNVIRQFDAGKQKQNLAKTGQIKNSIYLAKSLSPTNKLRSRPNFTSNQKISITTK